jgi:hypothetical protein
VGLAGVGAQVIVPQGEGKGVLLIRSESAQTEHRGRDGDLERPPARNRMGYDSQGGDQDAVLGRPAVDAQREQVGLTAVGGEDAKFNHVIAPDLRAVVAHKHVIGNRSREVEGVRRPGGA